MSSIVACKSLKRIFSRSPMTVSSLIEYLRPIICTKPVAVHMQSVLSPDSKSTQPHEFSSGKLKIDALIVFTLGCELLIRNLLLNSDLD